MRLGVVILLACACAGVLSLSSCVAQRGHPRADLPISREVAGDRNDAPRGTPRSIEYHPEALDVGTARMNFAAGRKPAATRTITVEPAPPPLPVSTPVRHVVAPGETLIAIARTRLGDERRWRDIVAANPGLDASSIKAGQALNLPR